MSYHAEIEKIYGVRGRSNTLIGSAVDVVYNAQIANVLTCDFIVHVKVVNVTSVSYTGYRMIPVTVTHIYRS